jgi:hypothetical protein
MYSLTMTTMFTPSPLTRFVVRLLWTFLQDYYACHCAGLAEYASLFFNIGTFSLVVHAGMTLANRLYVIQDSATAAYVYTAIFVTFGILIEFFHMRIHTKTRMAPKDSRDNSNQSNVDEFYDREKRIYEPLATVHTTKVRVRKVMFLADDSTCVRYVFVVCVCWARDA